MVKITIVTPDGSSLDLLEDACEGSSAGVVDHDFIVDDRAASPLPQHAANTSNSCWIDRDMIQPSNYFIDHLSEPTHLSALNGHAANGNWTIRVLTTDTEDATLTGGFGFILAADDPETAMTAGPGNGEQSGSSVSFGFGSPNVAGVSFHCSLDGTPFVFCDSPHPLTNLSAGSHTFLVRAALPDGNYVDPTPAEVNWTVAPPDTLITQHPKRRTTKRRVTFAFTATEAGPRFECKLDDRGWRACASPKLVLVKPGRHLFRVRAIDSAGNRDQTPATAVWRRTRR